MKCVSLLSKSYIYNIAKAFLKNCDTETQNNTANTLLPSGRLIVKMMIRLLLNQDSLLRRHFFEHPLQNIKKIFRATCIVMYVAMSTIQ